MRFRTLATALALTVGLLSISASAATIGHWSFEGSGGDWLLDSTGNGHDLTAYGTPSQYSLPATGPGSAFPNPVAQTGQPNLAAAQLSGSGQWLTAPDDDAFTSSTFTIETFLNIDTLSLGSTPIVAGHFDSNGDQRGWFFAINRDDGPHVGKLQLAISDNGQTGTGNTEVIRSPSLAIEAGKDYYAAIAVDATDTSADGIRFYLQNLTDGGALLSEGATHSQVTSLHNSTALFAIGAQGRSPGSGNFFPGVIDEVRFSNEVLGPAQLLAVPDSSTVGYWRFEDAPGFLADSGPLGITLSQVGTGSDVDQVAGTFPNPVLQTHAENLNAASFTGGDSVLLRGANTANRFEVGSFTVEAFVTVTGTKGNQNETSYVASHWNTSGNNRSWALGVDSAAGHLSGDPLSLLLLLSADGSETWQIHSNESLTVGHDYYVAASYDNTSDSDDIVFYIQDLTAGGGLMEIGRSSGRTSLNNPSTGSPFSIGALGTGNRWLGNIDEFRLSNTVLLRDQLLAVPEPGTLLLLATAALALLFRRRR